MNKILISTALLGSLFLFGCDGYKDHVPAEFSRILALKQTGEQPITLYTTGETGDYTVTILKGGTDPSADASAEFRVMTSAEMDEYNARTGKLYQAIPLDMFSIDNPTISFSGDEKYTTRVVTLKTDPIDALLKENPDANLVVPLTLVSRTDSINSQNNVILLKPSVLVPVLDYQYPTITVQNAAVNNSVEFRLQLPFASPWDLDATLEVDESAVPAGKSLLPGSAFTMPEDMKVTFKKGSKMSEPFTISLNPGDVFLWDDYVIPLKIASTSIEGIEIPTKASIVYVTNEIPLTANMLFTNAQEAWEGPISGLIDRDFGTFFHSAYSFAVGATHYIEVTLTEPIIQVGIKYVNRNNGNGKPTDVVISAFSGGEEMVLDHITSGLPTGAGSTYRSAVYTAAKPFTKLRFNVNATNSGSGPDTFFNMAELYIYGK